MQTEKEVVALTGKSRKVSGTERESFPIIPFFLVLGFFLLLFAHCKLSETEHSERTGSCWEKHFWKLDKIGFVSEIKTVQLPWRERREPLWHSCSFTQQLGTRLPKAQVGDDFVVPQQRCWFCQHICQVFKFVQELNIFWKVYLSLSQTVTTYSCLKGTQLFCFVLT